MPVEVSEDDFEQLVTRALERIPAEFIDRLENCAIVIDSEPDRPLLGLYEGIPAAQHTDYPWKLPDVITIFQGPLQRMCSTLEELEQQVYITVVHEVGHYFGLDDDQLHELNWG